MPSPITRKLSLTSSPIYFLCVLVIALSPMALRWIESASHVNVYRDAIGQPSDLLQNIGVPAQGSGPATLKPLNSGKVSGSHTGKTASVEPVTYGAARNTRD